MRMADRTHVYSFLWGAVAVLAVTAFGRSNTAHRMAVCSVAGGLRLKDEAIRRAENIREEAKDIYEEARREPDEGGQ